MTCSALLQQWPYKTPFRIARGTLFHQKLLFCRIETDDLCAQSEAEAAEFDEALADRERAVAANQLAQGLPDPAQIAALPPGPARNALDCLMWDVRAKRSGRRAWELADVPMDESTVVETVMTVTIDSPAAMARAAAGLRDIALLKVKLGSGDIDADIERITAVAAAAPSSALLVDPNEGWSIADLRRFLDATRALDIAMIEQPLLRTTDSALDGFRSPVPICADESCTTRESLAGLVGRYQAINIKLDKAGGLTEALALCGEARDMGFRIMTGCNGGTSLAIAPAFLIAAQSDVVDIDGPIYLVDDRPDPMRFEGDRVWPPSRQLWG